MPTIRVKLTPTEYAALAAKCSEEDLINLDECINHLLEEKIKSLLSYRVQFIT
ncbi:MAG: hypothetical protein RXO22_10165 [Thermocladium sp.]|jgi:hypothetical protein